MLYRLLRKIRNMGGETDDHITKNVKFKEGIQFEISERKGYISS